MSAQALSAQRVVSTIDVSGTGVWYGDSIHSAGSSLSPAVRIDWPSATINAFANLYRVGSGLSAQGAFAPSLSTPNAGPFSGEVAASFGGSTHQDGTRTGQLMGFARGYVSRADAGAWGGLGRGSTWDGTVWRRVRQWETGAWLQRTGITSLVTASPVVVEDSIRYTDLQAAVQYPTPRFELGATIGARTGAVGPAVAGSSRTWGSVSGIGWLSSRLAIVASAGTYPTDWTQGYPGGRFVSVALRLASKNAKMTEEPASSTRVDEPPSPAVQSFEARTASGVRRTLRVQAPSARTVEVSGDFTRWQAVSLVRGADGWWTVSLPIPAGAHQMNVRVDGGAWLVPPGLISTSDEFGGRVGILRIQ